MDNRLQSGKIEQSIMYDDLKYNFNKLLQLLSKTNFIYPDSSNIKTYDANVNVEIETSETHNYKLTFRGATTDGDSIICMIEIPPDYEKIKVDGESITEETLIETGGRSFLKLVIGVYKNENNETAGEKTETSVQYENFTVSYELDVSNVIIE